MAPIVQSKPQPARPIEELEAYYRPEPAPVVPAPKTTVIEQMYEYFTAY